MYVVWHYDMRKLSQNLFVWWYLFDYEFIVAFIGCCMLVCFLYTGHVQWQQAGGHQSAAHWLQWTWRSRSRLHQRLTCIWSTRIRSDCSNARMSLIWCFCNCYFSYLFNLAIHKKCKVKWMWEKKTGGPESVMQGYSDARHKASLPYMLVPIYAVWTTNPGS